MEKDIYIAKLGKTIGLNGTLKIYIESDFPEQFKKGATFISNRNLKLTIEQYNPQRDTVKFENINDVDEAKKLVNQQLFTSKESSRENCNLDANEYFWFDIIDCKVIENGKELGVVKDIHRYPVDDYLEIKTSKELIEKGLPKQFLLPYIIDTYIDKVNLEGKEILTRGAFDILENS